MIKWIGGIIAAIIAGVVVFHLTQNTNYRITNKLTQAKKNISQESKKDSGIFHINISSDSRRAVRNHEPGKISVFVTVFSEKNGSPIAEANVKIESDCAFFDGTDSNVGWGKTDSNGKLAKNLFFGRKVCGKPQYDSSGVGSYPSRIYNTELMVLVSKDGFRDWQNKLMLNLESGVAEIIK